MRNVDSDPKFFLSDGQDGTDFKINGKEFEVIAMEYRQQWVSMVCLKYF